MAELTIPRCDMCGRFFSIGEPGSSYVFVPDSHYTREELIERCRQCTAEYGPPSKWYWEHKEVSA